MTRQKRTAAPEPEEQTAALLLPVHKEYPWGDMTRSDPLGDVRRVVAEHFTARSTLYLTVESIRDLMQHPDVGTRYRHDWKYLFQVDGIGSCTGRDFIRFTYAVTPAEDEARAAREADQARRAEVRGEMEVCFEAEGFDSESARKAAEAVMAGWIPHLKVEM